MFVTKINIKECTFKVNYEDKILTLGSCFSESIGKKLENVYFNTLINPFGVLFNPVSIKNSLYYLLENKKFTEEDLFFDGNLWHSFSHSSIFSDINKEKVLREINLKLEESISFLQKTNFLFITFGSAWVYEYIKTGEIVTNCHKLPASEFTRYRLSVEDIVNSYKELIFSLKLNNPGLHIIFTVSPIRHWKDGAHENNLSKSTLLLAIDTLQKQFDYISYFPAYEILLDELRDYRYYAADMFHPSEVAVDYIWKIFCDCFFLPKQKTWKKN